MILRIKVNKTIIQNKITRISCVLSFFFCSTNIQAQFGDNIRTGRPGQAIGPYTVGQSILQFQTGLDYQSTNQSDIYLSNQLNPNTVIRYGVWELFEVSANISYLNRKDQLLSTDLKGEGFNNIALRVRSNIIQSEGFKPAIGWQFGVGLPLDNSVAFRENLAPKLIIVTGQSLGEFFSLTSNWGINWDGNFAQQQFFNVINLGMNLKDDWSVFIEEYSSLNDGSYDVNFDAGFAYLVNPNLQLDLYGGYDNNQFDVESWFISLGFSWRTSKMVSDE
jgi:hypothetical protein